jgi:hypothetical protein
VTYRIPAFEWAEGWYAFGLNRRFEDSQFVSSQISEAVAQRSGRVRGLGPRSRAARASGSL